MLKAFVELDASSAVKVRCKHIGTKLTYLHADVAETRPTLSGRHLLERSELLPEVSHWATQRNRAQARDDFEALVGFFQQTPNAA